VSPSTQLSLAYTLIAKDSVTFVPQITPFIMGSATPLSPTVRSIVQQQGDVRHVSKDTQETVLIALFVTT
jgi:hypothetical protein